MSAQETYRRFIEWLDQTWFGLPDSQHLLQTVKAAYSPEEAELLTGFPFKGTFLEELAELKGIDPGALKPRLEACARKGLIWRTDRDGRLRYSLNDAFFVFMRSLFWPQEKSQTARHTAEPLNKYWADGFMAQFAHAHVKGLRTLPIDKTIADMRMVMPFEDVVQVLENRQYYTVSDCPCRSRKRLDPESNTCDMPLAVCLHFDALGHYIVENGLGREITQKDTLTILTEAADAGLVHGLTNWQKNPDTICNCCACCCLFMEAYHRLGHHRALDPSNYIVEIRPETCKACGLCAERCPMEALDLRENPQAENKKGLAPALNKDICLGCGVCVHKCPSASLSLGRKTDFADPPLSGRDWMQRFVADRSAGPKYRSKEA